MTQPQSLAPSISAPTAVVSWRVARTPHRQVLGIGRHLIGNTGSVHIALPAEPSKDKRGIAAALSVSVQGMTLKCLSAVPPTFLGGRRLALGETIVIGDVIEIIVGQTTLVIAARGGRVEAAAPAPLALAAASADQVRQIMARQLLDLMNTEDLDPAKVDTPDVREKARLKLRRLAAETTLPHDFPCTRDELEAQVLNEVLGLGPLEGLLADPEVTEIMVNRRDQIYIERRGKLTLSPVTFSSNQALLKIIERIVSTIGRRIDTSSPIVDARLLDGSRVNAVIPPLALNGPCLTIRRFSRTPISVARLVALGSMDGAMAALLKLIVHERKNIIISGGTGSGKTTLLNALSSFIPDDERIVTIEDAAELQLQQRHVIRLETRPPNLEGIGAVAIRDLVRNTLRMRPDRIIVGECRGAEALDMLQAMNTGHDGSLTTAHANTPEDMLRRLETMVLMAGMDLPLRAIREQVVAALTVIVQQTRRRDGRRLVTDVSWIKGMDPVHGTYIVVPLVTRDAADNPVADDAALAAFWLAEALPGAPAVIFGDQA